jgi:AcrR family transcriptional regulator
MSRSSSLVAAAGVSRATAYRTFPGGREAITAAALAREGSRLYAAVADAVGQTASLHASLLAGLTTLWHHVSTHPAIEGVRTHRPEVLARGLRFESAARTYRVATTQLQPLLLRFMDEEAASRVGEYLCRVTVAYRLNPAPYLAIDDPQSVARFYGYHLAPVIDQIVGVSTVSD